MAMQLVINAVIRRGVSLGLLSTQTKKTIINQHMAVTKNVSTKVLPVLGIKAQETPKTFSDHDVAHGLHVTTCKSYPAAKPLPLPDNVDDIDDSELACFSPQRDRDISSSVILSKTDTSFGNGYNQQLTVDPHVASYDCHGALSLNSAMQTNVPEPFSSSGKATHLNMPGGQWGQGQKYISEDMQNSHYSKMSSNDSGIDGKGTSKLNNNWPNQPLMLRRHFSLSTNSTNCALVGPFLLLTNRTYCTSNKGGELSRKDKLKRAVKEYGSTVIVFHVGISLLSLGGCYLAVTSGINMGGVMNSLGAGSEVAAEAGQFVVAYAVHKVFAPVRISITLASTPFIVRYLRKIGFLKVPRPET